MFPQSSASRDIELLHLPANHMRFCYAHALFLLFPQILSTLFFAVEMDIITAPLWPQDGSVPMAPGITNRQYLRDVLLTMFTQSFPNL